MPWSSLSSRLASLPLVLAGPIVRKTTRTTVSVWIALKEEVSSLELIIIDGTTIINSPITSSKKFGKNLHIALLTINGLNLGPGRKFLYDINFGDSTRNLATPGVLSKSSDTDGISKIVYGGEYLPSFVLPSDNMGDLKIIHASCRKPHGGVIGSDDTDAFKAIDTIFIDSVLSGAFDQANRPQQLYLTGDQIYSDDVSDLLLFMLRDAEKALLGWPKNEQWPSAPAPSNLDPLHRLPLIRTAGFTTGYGNSHLLSLGEFYSMYLFVWSEELWPTPGSNFPGFAEYIYARDEGEYEQPEYQKKLNVLLNFFSTISSARRVLANISTYMILDDHEVTDDWNLNLTWVRKVYASADGKRIIQNGLSAYAVFQGWGNKPESFSNVTSHENWLLNALVTLNQHGEAGTSQELDFGDIAGLVIPYFSGTDLTGGIDWSYSLSFDKYNVIALNSRTNRALSKKFSGLLSNDAMVSQIRNRVLEKKSYHEFTLIIAPAPVFGLPLMEEFVQPTIALFRNEPAADFEPWSADRNKFEQFLKEISAFGRVLLLSGDVHYAFSNSIDYWDKRSGTEVRSKFVNLVSSSLKNSKSGPPDGTTLLADAVNNHLPEILLHLENDGLYVGWNSPGSNYIITEERRLLAGIPGPSFTGTRSVNGGRGIGVSHRHKLIPYSIKGRTSLIGIHYQDETREWVNPGTPPDWEYKIIFESDFRGDADRMAGTMPVLSSTAGMIGSGSRHRTLATTRTNHTIVGYTNIGEITFQWGVTENNKKIVHKIWSNVGGNFIPHTIHLLDFGIASTSDQKPSNIGRVP